MSDRLLVGTRKGLFDIQRGAGGAWEVASTAFLGSPVTYALRDPRDGALYAALDLGHFGVKLHRSDDDGATWKELAPPSYEGVKDGDKEPPSLKLIWILEPGGADEPGVLWAGTLPGGLFKTTDKGETWTLNQPLWDRPEREFWFGGGADQPGIHSICVHPNNSNVITLGVSCGGIWQTEDGGETWALGGEGLWAAYVPPGTEQDLRSQDVHRIARCAAAPDTLWIQHHNAAFRTEVGYARVEEIKPQPSVFGFPVAAHPKDPKTAWFAPAVKDEFRYPVDGQMVIARTRDGGQSFEILRNGLPQKDSYDLVYRHALEVDETGDRLAVGSTTGNLWITENGGDQWAEISGHLPPIYALRWA